MKCVIICPGRRPGLEGLWESSPLANKALFGKTVKDAADLADYPFVLTGADGWLPTLS